MDRKDRKTYVIASGKTVILRDRLPSDASSWVHWMTHGEWREYDAPWEGTDGIARKFLESCVKNVPLPRNYAMICTKENKPLGWVNRYSDKRFLDVWSVGINICEDEYLNKGIGTEALGLWIGYLFSNSDIHRIALATYSFNKRMMRVAEKLGFVFEGVNREIIKWQDKWLDRVHFGMLRKEWEKRRKV